MGDLLNIFELGILALIAIGFAGAILQGVLSYLSHRSLNDIHSLGIQAIIGANEMRIIDRSLEDSRKKKEENKTT